MTEDFTFKRVTYKSGEAELEYLMIVPKSEGKLPVVLHVHGMNKNGAWDEMLMGYFLAKAGYIAVLPSQPGFGLGGGQRDFCGPDSVQGISDAIDSLSQFDFIDSSKIGIWGISRGATVASQVITKIPEKIRAAVLQSGVYDMKKEYERPDRDPGIKENMAKETGGTAEAWEVRSSILNADKISAPVLLLHGDQDKNVSVEQAQLLDAKLTKLNKEHETVILPGLDHYMTRDTRRQHTFPFLEKHLK